jgi:hypothetical protein
MVFHKRPTNKKKKTIGRRHKKGTSYDAHLTALAAADLTALAAAAADGVAEDELDPAPAASSKSTPKRRKDDNWRSNRAVKSAKRAATKAIAERDIARVDHTSTNGKLHDALSRVKQVEHEQYMDRKAIRVDALKAEEEHKLALDDLADKFYEELDAAHDEVRIETSKRLSEEARRIEAEEKHSRLLRDERQHYSSKIEKEQTKLLKERRGQALQIDHLHDQWKQKTAATRLRIEKENAAATAKLLKDMEKNEYKVEKKNANEKDKILNKLEKKEEKLETVMGENDKR